MNRLYSHVVFTVKNSRYDYQRVQRKKQAGFIAKTFPLFEGKEEEMLIDILCLVAIELKIEIIEMNFCADYLHVIIYIRNNRMKHNLNPLSDKTIETIRNTIAAKK